MTRHEQLQERYEEALFALLMDDVAVAEGAKALLKNEELENDPQAAVPADVERRCLRKIRRSFSTRAARSVGRVTGRLISRVAVAALIAVLLVSFAFAASPTFRVNTLNFLIETFDEYTNFGPISPDNASLPAITAMWLPEGYRLEAQDLGRFQSTYVYQNSAGGEISVSVYNLTEGAHNVDTEDAELGTASINGYEAVTIAKMHYDAYGTPYKRNRLVWMDTSHGWCIDVVSCQESANVLVQFAENLVLE